MKLCLIILITLIANSLVLPSYVDARKRSYVKILCTLKRKPSIKIIKPKETTLSIIGEAAVGTIAGEATYDALKSNSYKENKNTK